MNDGEGKAVEVPQVIPEGTSVVEDVPENPVDLGELDEELIDAALEELPPVPETAVVELATPADPNPSTQSGTVEKNPVGRPSVYSQELADKICHELSEGKSLRKVCLSEDMPDASTIFRWLRTNEEFCKQYARAKEESADAMAEEILDLSDGAIGVIKGGAEKKSGALAQAVRLQVDTRKWLMSKMKPKRYADHLDLTSKGDKIIGNSIVFGDFKKEVPAPTDEANSQ